MNPPPRPPTDRPPPHPLLLRWLARWEPGRLVDAAQRRTTPFRAFAALVAVTAVTVAGLVVAAGPPAPEAPVKIARAVTESARAAPPSPTREAPRAMAAAPVFSPTPEGPSAPGGSHGASPGNDENPPGVPGQPHADFVGWAVLDRRTGAITGSDTIAATSTTASMIKVWLVADYLRRIDEAGQIPSQAKLDQLTLIVRDSHNEHTQTLFQELGRHASIDRLISVCALTDSYPVPNFWSNTQLSARDTARMGVCLADGRAAGPEWTGWLIDEMRAVRGIGDFGIRHALPPAQRSTVAIKNGWVIRSDEGAWHVNCLAVSDTWAMGVLTRYPAHLGYEHGAEICRSLAAQHLP